MAALNEKLRVVVVGGVAGGASAAARVKRLNENADVVVFEKGSDSYQKITGMIRSLMEAQLDKNEQIEGLGRRLDQTLGVLDLSQGTYLTYEYAADSYAPVYFELTDTQNSVVGIYSPIEDSLTLHGFWSAAEAQELLDYLNKQ